MGIETGELTLDIVLVSLAVFGMIVVVAEYISNRMNAAAGVLLTSNNDISLYDELMTFRELYNSNYSTDYASFELVLYTIGDEDYFVRFTDKKDSFKSLDRITFHRIDGNELVDNIIFMAHLISIREMVE